ncbi:MAG: acylneuraminate cytidylyltransferase [Verrucomicrobiota bacterium]
MSCVAIIPARGGSKGIRLKNLRKIGGVRLICRAIAAARGSRNVDEVIVSTDCPEIAKAAIAAGALVITRPPELSTDTATSESAIEHCLLHLRDQKRLPDYVAFLQCTSPFTTSAEIDSVLAPVINGEFETAFSVVPSHGFFWRLQPDGNVTGANHNEASQRVRRQDLASEYKETGAVYAFNAAAFLTAKNRFTGRIKAVVSSNPPFDIDVPSDIFEAHQTAVVAGISSSAAPAVKVLVTDFDGVHTNAMVAVREDGTEGVECNRRDGFAIGVAKKTGLRILILSKERNAVVVRRAEKLGVECIAGCDDKLSALRGWLHENSLSWDDIAYVGDDLNDLDGLQLAARSFCPADADPDISSYCDTVLDSSGGNGCVREVIRRLGFFNYGNDS